MTWFKVDDGLHAHRKVRAVRRSHSTKTRDTAPFGLWVLAGSWCGDNPTGGFVPAEVLAEWDDDWQQLAARLVAAGLWWETAQDGEEGYGFHDWHDYVPSPEGIADAKESGRRGNHVRWHERRGEVDPECEFCIGSDRGDIGAIIAPNRGANRVPDRVPVPTRPDPTRPEDPSRTDPSGNTAADRFDEFWDAYDHKQDRKRATTAWRNAIAKPGVTADRVIAAAAAYVAHQKANGKHPTYTKNPTTWLHGECWDNPLPATPTTRMDEHRALVLKLQAEERAHTHPQIGAS